eukprot:80323-Rhodomonas_salina.1
MDAQRQKEEGDWHTSTQNGAVKLFKQQPLTTSQRTSKPATKPKATLAGTIEQSHYAVTRHRITH